MAHAKLPIIFESNHLALLLGRSRKYLASVINCPEKFYRTFNIAKKSGGHREISAPYPSLLECQQWINKNILAKIKVHPAAKGFIPKMSIVDNARPHLSKAKLLKIDLTDFFPSIPFNRIIKIFLEMGYPHNVSFSLARISCLGDALPQGAATSPALSNIVSRQLDKRLGNLSNVWKINYTRYADDITFSGDNIPHSYIKMVERIIREEGFEINRSKTRYCHGPGRKIVTGLSVKGPGLKVPRGYKRKLKQEIYYMHKYGAMSHITKMKIRKPNYSSSIHGRLLFWKFIEQNNDEVDMYVKKFERVLGRQ